MNFAGVPTEDVTIPEAARSDAPRLPSRRVDPSRMGQPTFSSATRTSTTGADGLPIKHLNDEVVCSGIYV